MTAIEASLICMGFFLQAFVFLLGLAVGASMRSRSSKTDENRRRYEEALRFWHTPTPHKKGEND